MHGIEPAWRQVLRAVAVAFERAGLPTPAWGDCALAAGLAGVNEPTQAAAFVAANPGFRPLLVDTDSFTALVRAGVASLDRVAQDGMRVRAAAGAASFRRQATLQECRRQAEAAVRDLCELVVGEVDPEAAPLRAAQILQGWLEWGIVATVSHDTLGSAA